MPLKKELLDLDSTKLCDYKAFTKKRLHFLNWFLWCDDPNK